MQVTKEKMGKDKETQAIIQASPNTPIISIMISKAHGKYGILMRTDWAPKWPLRLITMQTVLVEKNARSDPNHWVVESEV
jgi:hypothetical protein